VPDGQKFRDLKGLVGLRGFSETVENRGKVKDRIRKLSVVHPRGKLPLCSRVPSAASQIEEDERDVGGFKSEVKIPAYENDTRGTHPFRAGFIP